MSRLALALATVVLGACASGMPSATPAPSPAPASSSAPQAAAAPARPAALNPVGTFEFATEVNGSPMKGVLNVAGMSGSYTGSMKSDITPELPLTSVAVSGQTMKVVLDTPNGAATINLTFTGDTFTGTWELGGAGGPLTGKRIK
jgi:hypothetical protein